MFLSTCTLLLSAHLAAALFYHELSAVDLKDGTINSAYGFSLGYQSNDARLVIGAPLYSKDGKVYHCSVKDIKNKKCNDPVDIDFKGISNRTVNPDQHFYLGASIAAKKSSFVVCAPLRTAYFANIDLLHTKTSAAFGACFIYDNIEKTPKMWSLNSDISISALWVEGGGGWSTLVDDNDRVIISQLFENKAALCGQTPKAEYYSECFKPQNLSLATTYGQAMTFGNYFSENKTCYAFSINSIGEEKGYIDFFSNDPPHAFAPGLDCPRRLNDKTESVGSMFGASLCSADVTRDSHADLLVGAPAQHRPADYDTGAIHIYSKSINLFDNEIVEMDLLLTIWGVKSGSRFGTTLSTNDVNGDSYPEIIVSAPFEKSGGVLYILCGYAIHETIKNKRTGTISVSELARTQRIKKSKSFGFSLQPVSDYNDNGSDELAVGAPEESTVTMYRGIQAITVNVTSEFTDYATKTDTEFGFASCVTFEKPKEPKEITMRLLVKNVLTGDKATFKSNEKDTYEIVLTDKPTDINGTLHRYCRDYVIASCFSCKVNTTVSLMEDIETVKEFKNTWVTISPQSSLTKETQPQCNCGGSPCEPEYSVELLWSGKTSRTHQYIVGSSDMETVTIIVSNNGTMGCGACANVRVSGTLVGVHVPCAKEMGAYKCELPAPFRTGTNKTIEVQLQTNTLSIEEKGLTIDVEVRKECTKPEAVHSSLTLNYDFENVLENVVIQGSTINRVISDAELDDSKEDKLTVEQTYTIYNNHSFQWKKVFLAIDGMDNTYIEKSVVRVGQPNKCSVKMANIWKCSIPLASNSTTTIIVSSTIVKNKLAIFLKKGTTKITSSLKLKLLPDKTKDKTIYTVITLEEKPKSPIGTILIAIGVGLLLLLIIGVILYKLNFFKRKTKEDLEVLKNEMKGQSLRSGTSSDNRTQPAVDPAVTVPDPDHDFDMVDLIVDETPLAKSLSSELLNSLAANPDSVKLEDCPKKPDFDDKDGFTHVY